MAVIGVVIVGVLASFTVPGPFDWGATLIGVVLLTVLYAYVPTSPLPESPRRAAGTAAAAAFCLLLILGRPLDVIVGSGDDRRHLLSHWPEPAIKRADDRPDSNGGWELGVLWLILFVLLMAAWRMIQQKEKRTEIRPAASGAEETDRRVEPHAGQESAAPGTRPQDDGILDP